MSGFEFEWGKKVVGSLSSYDSMRFDGIWYALLDCVFARSGLAEPHIGKLMRLYEEDGIRKIRVRWFLRATELPISAIKDLAQGSPKEIFIAQGSLRGVENENVVDVILGKANVICTAKCPKNPQPSQVHVDGAHHFFNRAYDVSNKKLLRVGRIEKSLAQKFWNKPEWLPAVEKTAQEDPRSPKSVTDFEWWSRKHVL